MDDKDKPIPPEGEPREPTRPYSLEEAIGRAAGDALKGASPVAATDQLLLEIRHLLDTRLVDGEGSLRRTIQARLQDDLPLLGRHLGDPVRALQAWLGRILAEETLLAALVRDTDARWGRDYGERPHFENGEAPPTSDDPYTIASVRTELTRLQAALTE